MLLLKYLIILRGTESVVLFVWYLWRNQIAEILRFIAVFPIFISWCQSYSQADEATHQFGELHVEIVKERYLLLIEWPEVILVILEEGGVTIGRFQGIPMPMAPVPMIADTDVTHQTLAPCGFLGRDSECQKAIGISNQAAVAVGLLAVTVMCLNVCYICAAQLAVVLHWGQVGR